MSLSRDNKGLGGVRRGFEIPFETLSSDNRTKKNKDNNIDDLFNRFGKILNVDLDHRRNKDKEEEEEVPPIPFVEFEDPAPRGEVTTVLQQAPRPYNIYDTRHEGGLYRSSSVASVFGGYSKLQRPILSPPKLTSVQNNQLHHYQMMSYSNIQYNPCSNPFMVGYYNGFGSSQVSSMHHQQGFNLRNIYNSSPSNSQSSGFVSRGTNFSIEAMHERDRDYRNKCQFTTASLASYPRPRRVSASSSGQHCHCCHCSCSRQSVASRSSQQSFNSSNDKFSRDMSTKSSNIEAFSDDDDDMESASVHSVQVNQKGSKSRIIKKGTIKTDSVTLESGSTFNTIFSSISNFILRIFIFLTVLCFFCVFFVGKWPEPIDGYVDYIHDLYHYLWDSIVPYFFLYFPTSDINSTVLLY